MKLFILITTAALLLAVPSRANITVSVDIINNTLKFDGSVSVSPGAGFFFYENNATGSFIGQESIALSSGVSFSSPEVTSASLLIGDFAGVDSLSFTFDIENPQVLTLAGNGTLISYDLNSTYETILEDLAAAETVATIFSGTSTGTFMLVAVPEPAAYAPLLGLCCAVLVLCRRRCR